MSDVAVGLVQRRRRSRVEAEQLVREYESSGLTRQAFCAGRGLSVAGWTSTDGGKRRSALWVELPNGRRIGVAADSTRQPCGVSFKLWNRRSTDVLAIKWFR